MSGSSPRVQPDRVASLRRGAVAVFVAAALTAGGCAGGAAGDGVLDGLIDLSSASPGDTPATSDRGDAGGPAGRPSSDDPLLLPVPSSGTWTGRVVKIADGDTLTIEVVDPGATGHEPDDRLRIRLLRIDTPELARDGRPGECFGEEATAMLASLAPLGTVVTLAYDEERVDRYDRELAHLWNAAGHWINGELLDRGAAEVVTFRPNVAHTERVEALQAEAQAAGRGRWSACPA